MLSGMRLEVVWETLCQKRIWGKVLMVVFVAMGMLVLTQEFLASFDDLVYSTFQYLV